VATLIRPYLSYSGNVRYIPYEVCRCGERNGMSGGLCAVCGDAIPTRRERLRLNRMEDVMMSDPKYDPNQTEEPKKDEPKKKQPEHEDEEEEETQAK
jgi:hypothetical protein